MKWTDIKAVIAKDPVRKKERLAMLRSMESAWKSGGSDQVKESLRQKVKDAIKQAQLLKTELIGNHEDTGEEDSDANED